MNWKLESVIMDWDESIESKIDKFINDIEPVVNKVEAKITEYKEEPE